jgi:hypothetical protein
MATHLSDGALDVTDNGALLVVHELNANLKMATNKTSRNRSLRILGIYTGTNPSNRHGNTYLCHVTSVTRLAQNLGHACKLDLLILNKQAK